jgi:hypothetical protein
MDLAMTPLICAICHQAPATKPDSDPSVCRRCYADLNELDKAEPGKALGHPPYRPLEE